jgi:hypothetical protein
MIDLGYLFMRIEISPAGCWLWSRGLTKAGYGQVRINQKQYLVHRLVYQAVRGPIPRGFELDHLCRRRQCCNPMHLEVVTHRENVLRGVSRPAMQARKTHCVAGHPFTEENTIHIQGGRRCRECVNERNRRYWRQRYGKRGNAQTRKTHCPYGHPYDDNNTYRHDGRRHCKACMRERAAKRRKARAAGKT